MPVLEIHRNYDNVLIYQKNIGAQKEPKHCKRHQLPWHDSAVSRLEHVNRECFDRIDHLETDNHFHETQFGDRDAINRARVRQIWRTAETVVQDNNHRPKLPCDESNG